MNGIVNIIHTVDNYWTYILVALGLIIYAVRYIKNYMKMTDSEKLKEQERLVKIALEKVKVIMPNLTAIAEEEWNHLDKAGIIKRSEVINKIYEQYPILKEYYDQEWLVNQLDIIINEALKEIRDITRNVEPSDVFTENMKEDREVE